MTKCNKQAARLWRLAAVAVTAAGLLGACGGGGDDGGSTTGGNTDTGGNGGGGTTTQRLALRAFENLAFRAVVVDGSTGARTVLPESGFTGVGADSWSVRIDGAEAVRLDARENIAIVSTTTGARVGGFALSAVAGSSNPDSFTEPLLSPDGRYLLCYWRADSQAANPSLVIWDRLGNVVAQGSPFAYDRRQHANAIGWTPDGMALYLAGTSVVRLNPVTGSHTRLGTIVLPAGTSTVNAGELRVSPDGTRLAVSLPTLWTSDDGQFSEFSRMVYVMNLDGSGLRQLTLPSARIRNSASAFDVLNSVWSPDGTQLAATPRSSAGGCPRVKLLQADASAAVPVDDIFDSDSGYLQLPPAGGGTSQTAEDVCEVLAWWRP